MQILTTTKGRSKEEHDAREIQTMLQKCSQSLPKRNVNSPSSSYIITLTKPYSEETASIAES